MNKVLLLTAAGLVSFGALVHAESGAPVTLPASNEQGGEREHPSFRHQGGGSNESEYVDRWLNMLKENNPEEFARAKKMREENPEEFRKHLHQKLQDMRMKGGPQPGQLGGSLREHPNVVEAMKNLPPEDREWVMQRLLQPQMNRGDFMQQRGDSMPDLKRPFSPEIQKAEERARELARKCRAAGTDDERLTARKELRESIGAAFDLREKTRAESFTQMEEKFSKLRRQIDERKTNREKIIDEYLEELVRGDLPPR